MEDRQFSLEPRRERHLYNLTKLLLENFKIFDYLGVAYPGPQPPQEAIIMFSKEELESNC